MTREEYDRKAAAGTLTVGDVLRNREHATPEQLDAVTGFVAVHLDAELFARPLQGAAVLTAADRIATETAAACWGAIPDDPAQG